MPLLERCIEHSGIPVTDRRHGRCAGHASMDRAYPMGSARTTGPTGMRSAGRRTRAGGRSIPPGPGRDADRGWHARLHREDLGSLTVPTLVLVGRHDFICGMHWAEELHRVIPGSELLILENSGHFGHIEEPEAFSPAVTRFVATVNSPGI
ncbi:alpha/beta fold hydrolase [Streptomyces mirabilis]|uniref:alpha/beta fold hydrolase n=2 Tax=Streptomyces mirabilis TaxID=68239 RepID=UPI0036B55B5C